MFAFVAFYIVIQRLADMNISKMTYFVLGGM